MAGSVESRESLARPFSRIDSRIAAVDRWKTSDFEDAISTRKSVGPEIHRPDSEILRIRIEAIAFSQQAWDREIEQRVHAYRAGQVGSTPAEVVYRSLRGPKAS